MQSNCLELEERGKLRKQGCRAVAYSKKSEKDFREQGCRAVA